MRRVLIVMLLSCMLGCAGRNTESPERDIEKIIQGRRATVGVAVMSEEGKIVASVNDSVKYPAMSVFKFHVVAAALDRMASENIPLDSMVCVRAASLYENTYSPLREACGGRDTCLSISELMRYTIALSDNNTCDLLIDFAGGIGSVCEFVRSAGIDGFDFTQTEDSMHEDIMRCYNNWLRPSSMVRFMERIYESDVLAAEYREFLERIMTETSTGNDKIKAGVPEDVRLGHKTGNSDRTDEGIKIGDNDAAVVYLPGGGQYYLAVFVKDSAEPDSVNAAIIADIARAAYASLGGGDD